MANLQLHSVDYNAVATGHLHSFSCCWLPYLWNPAKFSENSNL